MVILCLNDDSCRNRADCRNDRVHVRGHEDYRNDRVCVHGHSLYKQVFPVIGHRHYSRRKVTDTLIEDHSFEAEQSLRLIF